MTNEKMQEESFVAYRLHGHRIIREELKKTTTDFSK
jgi:hypothetical protein